MFSVISLCLWCCKFWKLWPGMCILVCRYIFRICKSRISSSFHQGQAHRSKKPVCVSCLHGVCFDWKAVLCYALIAGHNWGSEHDPDTRECSPSSASGGKYIMYTYSVSGIDSNNQVSLLCSSQLTKDVVCLPVCIIDRWWWWWWWWYGTLVLCQFFFVIFVLKHVFTSDVWRDMCSLDAFWWYWLSSSRSQSWVNLCVCTIGDCHYLMKVQILAFVSL